MTKFKIQGVGLDTSTINYDPGIARDSYDYIYTSIPANNDFLVGRYIWSMENNPDIITYVDCLDGLLYLVESHLLTIKRESIKILLFKSGGDLNHAANVAQLLVTGTIKYFGLQNPKSVETLKEEIERFSELGVPTSYVALNNCPLEFNLEIINYCRENNIEIIGLNSFGGFLSAGRNITAFSVPYLLGFSAYYCDLVILSGRDLINSWQNKEYLSKFIGKDADPGYILKKSTYKPVKDIKKAVFTSISLENGHIVPYEDPERIVMPDDFKFRIGSYISKINPPEKSDFMETDTSADVEVIFKSLEEEVNHFIDLVYLPEDGTLDDKFATIRYKVMGYLETHFGEGLAEFDLVKIGNSILMISVTQPDTFEKESWWKKKKLIPGFTRQFYLIISEEGNIIFNEILAKEKE